MRAVLRWRAVWLAGGLWLMPTAALAQQTTPPAATNTPATDAIGPSELQNFSLPGTKTRPVEQPPAASPTTTPSSRAQQPPATASQSQGARRSPVERRVVRTEVPTSAPPPGNQAPLTAHPSAPPPSASIAPAPQPAGVPAATPIAPPPGPPVSPDRNISFLPWLIAALALAGGLLFFLWQRRPREALADGPAFDLFAPPEPSPEPVPPAAPRAAPRPSVPVLPPVPEAPKPSTPAGIVSSRLRPSLEIAVQPLRCVVDDSQVTIEFELDLFNAGSAPARAVLAEATLFNPGATQEQELSAFFSNPVGAGNRLDAIPPLKRITLTSQVVAPRAAIQEYELAGRKSFVPVIAFNALYEWSGGKGQTSAAYLVGRETAGEKLGPVRLDQGAREVRKLSARALPMALRT